MKASPVLPASSFAAWQKLSGEELYAHYLYLHIANKLQAAGYFGAQKFFESESAGELTHYLKIRDFVNDMGGVLGSINTYQISDDVAGIDDALNVFYSTELALLQKYHEAYKQLDQSPDEDCISEPLMLEFIRIQTKGVGEAGDLLKRFEIAKASGEILLFDQELAGK